MPLGHGRPQGGASVGRRPPLENLKKKKKLRKKKEKKKEKKIRKKKLKKFERKKCTNKILSCKRPIVCYVRKFPHKRPHVMC